MDIMIDLETFGNSSNSIIVQIGACAFDIKTGRISNTFLVNVEAKSCADLGGEFTASTVYWWLDQHKEAINSILSDNRYTIHQALGKLNNFLELIDFKDIWCHCSFDAPILQNWYRKTGIIPLFEYHQFNDIRTLLKLSGYKKENYIFRHGVRHTALSDCLYQIGYCSEAYVQLKYK